LRNIKSIMKNRKPKIVVIVGPTASGKSTLAVQLAKKFNGEIVSADSRQVYRGMDIGTAKPEVQRTSGLAVISEGIPHYLINIKNPDENYTVAEYKRDAIKAINKIIKKKKLSILVGGTGLYIKAIVDNLNIPKVAPDFKLRKKLEKEIKKYGLNFVFNKLIKLDPEAAYVIDPNNPRRIIRALEIAIKIGKPFSAQCKTGKPLFNFIEIGIRLSDNILNKRINKRVDLMIKSGLLEEVKNLVKKYGPKQQSFDAIGYREIIDFLNGKISLEEATELIKKNTRNYAKRQMTWFKKDPTPEPQYQSKAQYGARQVRYGASKRIHWIKNEKEAEKLIKKFLKNNKM